MKPNRYSRKQDHEKYGIKKWMDARHIGKGRQRFYVNEYCKLKGHSNRDGTNAHERAEDKRAFCSRQFFYFCSWVGEQDKKWMAEREAATAGVVDTSFYNPRTLANGDDDHLDDVCPNCNREYDDVDREYQICSKCKFNNTKP